MGTVLCRAVPVTGCSTVSKNPRNCSCGSSTCWCGCKTLATGIPASHNWVDDLVAAALTAPGSELAVDEIPLLVTRIDREQRGIHRPGS